MSDIRVPPIDAINQPNTRAASLRLSRLVLVLASAAVVVALLAAISLAVALNGSEVAEPPLVVAGILCAILILGLAVGVPLSLRMMRRCLSQTQDSADAAEILKSAILETSLDGFILMDHKGTIRDWNPAAEAIFGLSREDALGRLLGDTIIPEELRAAHRAGLARYTETQEAKVLGRRFEMPGLRADGTRFPCEISIVRIPSTEPPLFAGSLRDISERAETDAALRESEERFRALADHITQLAWMADADGSIFWYNEQWFTYTGTTFPEMEGCGWKKVHHPDHVDRVVRKFTEHIASGEIWEDTFPLRAADGGFRWFLSRARAIRDETGKVTRWFGTNTDVTTQRELTDQLANAKELAESSALGEAEMAKRFRLLAETVSLQVWTATPDGKIDFANQEVADYFAIPRDAEALGDRWVEYVHPDDLPTATENWRRALATGDLYEVEFRLKRANGEYRWFLARAQPKRDRNGRIELWFGVNTDINELKSAQREAEAASRAKDDFLAALSHELRTPLTPVLMAAASLWEDARLPAEVRAQLAMIERNIALEARLIDDLLDLTRIVKGKLQLRREICDAHSLIGLAVEIVRKEASAKEIALECRFAAQRSGLVADQSRFQQVMWNLLRNAVKFTPNGGRIEIHTYDEPDEEDRSRLRVEVVDSGIGIDPVAIERIFRPFEQATATGDHRFGGLGLGLAIARAIVDLHGGTIRAESDGHGKGSAFIVEMPSAIEPPAGFLDFLEDRPTADSERPDRAAPMKLLLVEDHEETLAVLRKMLTRDGHEVVVANCVADAVSAAGVGEFDFVVSDLGLPDGTGNSLMETLRDRHGLTGIALSGYGMEDDLQRSRASGFALHLVKPVDYAQLRKALQTLAQTCNPTAETAPS